LLPLELLLLLLLWISVLSFSVGLQAVGVIKVTAIARQPEKILLVEIFLNQDSEILMKSSKVCKKRKRCARTSLLYAL